MSVLFLLLFLLVNLVSAEVLEMPVKGMKMEYTSCPITEQYKYSTVWTGNYDSGCEGTGTHVGVDIPLPEGTDIYAIANGVVWKIGRYGVKGTKDFGAHVVLKHDIEGIGVFYSVYGHLKNDTIPKEIVENKTVLKGTIIGKSGNTGYVLGPTGLHLHFQIEKDIAGQHPYLVLPDIKTVKEKTYNPIVFINTYKNYDEKIKPGTVLEGTFNQYRHGSYPMIMEVTDVNGNEFSGLLHWPTLKDSKTKFRGTIDFEQNKVWFTEYELIQGSNIVLDGNYYAELTGSTLSGYWIWPSGKEDGSNFLIKKVNDVNKLLTLAAIGDKIVNENSLLTFVISATNQDGDTETYSAIGMPLGATLDTTTGEFSWTPGTDTVGTYDVTFSVTTNGLTDSETITITVKEEYYDDESPKESTESTFKEPSKAPGFVLSLAVGMFLLAQKYRGRM